MTTLEESMCGSLKLSLATQECVIDNGLGTLFHSKYCFVLMLDHAHSNNIAQSQLSCIVAESVAAFIFWSTLSKFYAHVPRE